TTSRIAANVPNMAPDGTANSLRNASMKGSYTAQRLLSLLEVAFVFGISANVNPIRHAMTAGLYVPNTADRGYSHNSARHRSCRDCLDNACSHTRNCS